MAIFYHIDRLGRLKGGDVLHPFQNKTVSLPQNILLELFDNKISSHGQQYLTSPFNNQEIIFEIVFEYVRVTSFSEMPSRFQSVFAFKTLSAAKNFQGKYQNHSFSRVWEVEGENPVEADMNLLTMSPTLLHMISSAYRYWSGETNPNSTIEVLLSSATLLREVE